MYTQLCAYAYGILRDKELSEEAVQETFRIVCSKPNDVISSKNPKGWVMEALKRVLRNTQRKRAALERHIIAVESMDINQVISCGCENNIDLMYSDLVSQAEFQLLKRIAIGKCTMLEAAEELGISVEACKKRAQRAARRLREKVEEIGVP